MNNKQILLQRAEERFLHKDYSSALKIYGLILKDHPSLKEAEVGAYLSDMGLDSGEDAQALFEYYHAIKSSAEDADRVISDLMQVIYSTRIVVKQVFDSTNQNPEPVGGINYADFIDLVENKKDFKQVFENIMFSTKVIISTKEEFIDFIKRLISDKYYDMALGYLDVMAGDPVYNQDVYALYKLLPKES